MKKIRYSLACIFLLLLLSALAVSVLATGYNSVSQNAQTTAEKKLITARAITLTETEDVLGVHAEYGVDKAALSELEMKYRVTFGAVVARDDSGYTQADLTPTYDEKTGRLVAPLHTAMLTVYSTGGTRPVNASFLTEKRNSFSVTLDIGKVTVERAECGAINIAFVLLEDPSGDEAPRIYTISRKGASVGTSPSVADMKRLAYQKDQEDPNLEKEYIEFLQAQVKGDVDMLSSLPVYICGVDAEENLAEGERAIWVEYLPDRDPYPDGKTYTQKTIRAAYIYYPTNFDPSLDYTNEEMIELGVTKRIFAYIGVPERDEDVPGLVCVHGGGGHAYAKYVHEAMQNGYAAIAFDTEGYHNVTGGKGGTAYSELDSAYAPDVFGHKPKDSFAKAKESLTEQWLYYAVYDTALANTVLRSLTGVDPDAVGITGISWGGLITSTAICYDHRYAFAAPIYISFHMAESYGISVGGLKEKPFAAALWQDQQLFAASPVPTIIISSEHDLFASVDTVSKSANDLKNGTLLIKPGLTHGQQFAAALPEVYHFGYQVLAQNGGFVTATEAPTLANGRRYTLTLDIPEDVKNVRATLYYRNEPLKSYSDTSAIVFTPIPLTVTDKGTVDVVLPEDVYMYFISFAAYSEDAYARKEGTPYIASDKYTRGDIYSSTDLVIFD